MIRIDDVGALSRPLLVCAFEGWNDAAEAATEALDHLIGAWDAIQIGAVEPEEFYDFQVNRPHTHIDENGVRGIEWRTTEIHLATDTGAGRDVVLVRGIEPSLRWQTFTRVVLDTIRSLGVEQVVTLGALLAETPHTRAIPVHGSTADSDLRDRLGLESSSYEGPTGIVGVLQHAFVEAGIPAVSFWASIPHYLPQPPCPKGSLALLRRLEDMLGATLPVGDLPDDVAAWERGVSELAEEDEEIAAYIRQLEESVDAVGLPEASGEAIAAEFERYLRRRRGNGGTGGPG